MNKNKKKMLLITIVVLILCFVIGFFVGKWLFDVLH